tara:strand:+ start:455 stop:670 length:216 start_codon:yes stop_codon:yes gene_type:complete
MSQKAPAPKPTVAPPPPPEKAPSELENAIDSNATALKKKKKGAKGVLGRGSSGTQVAGSASGSGLTIGKGA